MPTTPSPGRDLRRAAGWHTIRPGLALATSVHLEVDWVARRTEQLAQASGRPVSANGYWSTGGAFAPHADAEDARIVQVAGRRRWWLHPPTTGDRPPSPDRWHTLGPAAELELPAGWWHQAHTLSAESIHVTFTLHGA